MSTSERPISDERLIEYLLGASGDETELLDERGIADDAIASRLTALENDLVDEINLLIVPVVLGQGTRLFPDTGQDIALELVGSQAVTPSGVTIKVYRPTGRPQYATASAT